VLWDDAVEDSKLTTVRLKPEDQIRRVIICSGKVYYDLLEAREEAGVDDVIGGRDNEAEVGDGRTVIPERAEWTDLGHGTSRNGASPQTFGTTPSYDSRRSDAGEPSSTGNTSGASVRDRW